MQKLFLSVKGLVAALALMAFSPGAMADSYGLPSGIQEGNILHCFNWPISDIKAELPNIAAAGFGSVQISPVQRPDSKTGSPWHDLYRPYDLSFKGSSYCSEQDLRNLCTEAAKYGIKIIVDVVANHVDKTAGYHDPWWDSNNRVRWNGGINYGDRYSITHGQLGDYGDVNSEHSDVIAKGKAYVEQLKSMGVKGIRWDAAKHIALPSEGCGFWSAVTSVQGMYHYGEILDNPGPDPSIIKEYCNYMSVTDNQYCNYAARDNGGIPTGYGGSWAVNYGLGAKCVYWAESHDTYSNDEWSMDRDQGTIDRAYAAYACRNNEAALYLSRPNTKGFNNIKVGKGSTAFNSKAISEVNKFRNMMVGKADWFESNGNACSITRKDGGAVIVMKGSGNVSVKNGGGYCPSGTYTDRVSGGTFTVNGSTISGNVGSSGIAVIYANGVTPPDPGPTPDPNPTPDPTPSGSMWILGNIDGHQWTPNAGAAMTLSGSKYIAKNVKFVAAAGETTCYFNITDALGSTATDWDGLNMAANRYGAATEGAAITLGSPASVTKYTNNVNASACLSWTIPAGTYDITFDASAMTLTVVNAGSTPDPDPNPTPDPDPVPNPTPSGSMWILGNIDGHQWTPNAGAAMTLSGSKYIAKNVKFVAASGETTCYFNITDALGSTATDWDGLNMAANRYGAATEGAAITLGSPASVTKYTNNVNASACLSWTIPAGTYDITFDTSAMTLTVVNAGSNPDPDPNPTPDPDPVPDPTPGDAHYIYYDGTFSNPTVWAWTSSANCNSNGTWPGDKMEQKNGKWYWALPAGKDLPTQVIISENGGTKIGGGDLEYKDKATYHQDGTFSLSTDPNPGPTPDPDPDPNPGPTPDPVPVPVGTNLITDYYKVNPNGQVGKFKTINMTGHPATNAFSNWGPEDLIAQGVARDVCQAFKGVHERPVVDSYALYAAYDNENLYLGVQFVYTIWDIGGEGKQPGESKPYNMDGHMVIALDLDPQKSFDGYIDGTGPIWNEVAKGAKFTNGVDAVIMCSTKPGVGTPGLFLPTPDGHASYSAAYCKALPAGFWGYKDGLLPSIEHVWGQDDFSYDPELLKGNTGFIDLRSEIDDSAHTFYEFKLPLSSLGITADYIKNQGIGVMYLDKYGTSPVGGTPYDPSFFDNVSGSYSQDSSSSQEKEDEDVITYAPARIGKMATTAVDTLPVENSADLEVTPVYYNLQGVQVANPDKGIYIVVRGNKVSKEIIR